MYVILNEKYAWKLILEQECFSANEFVERKGCLGRTWERYRHRLSEKDAKYIYVHKEAKCTKINRIGHLIQDGGWDICVDDFPPSNVDKKLVIEAKNGVQDVHKADPRILKPCIVYSFGINDDPSFDKDLTNRWSFCTVYAFDPSIGRETGDTFLGPNIKFYSIGLGREDMTSENEHRGWQIMTLESIMKMLDHDHINLLKIDIEGDEWETFESWRQSAVYNKIGQLIGEVHFHPDNVLLNIRQVQILKIIHDFGFHVFHRQDNFRWSRLINVQYERKKLQGFVRTYSCLELGWKRINK